jgi:hypothetical protein
MANHLKSVVGMMALRESRFAFFGFFDAQKARLIAERRCLSRYPKKIVAITHAIAGMR